MNSNLENISKGLLTLGVLLIGYILVMGRLTLIQKYKASILDLEIQLAINDLEKVEIEANKPFYADIDSAKIYELFAESKYSIQGIKVAIENTRLATESIRTSEPALLQKESDSILNISTIDSLAWIKLKTFTYKVRIENIDCYPKLRNKNLKFHIISDKVLGEERCFWSTNDSCAFMIQVEERYTEPVLLRLSNKRETKIYEGIYHLNKDFLGIKEFESILELNNPKRKNKKCFVGISFEYIEVPDS